MVLEKLHFLSAKLGRSDLHDPVVMQSRTQSNANARARMALALGKLNFSCAVIGLTCMPTKPEPLNLGVPVVNFPRANAT